MTDNRNDFHKSNSAARSSNQNEGIRQACTMLDCSPKDLPSQIARIAEQRDTARRELTEILDVNPIKVLSCKKFWAIRLDVIDRDGNNLEPFYVNFMGEISRYKTKKQAKHHAENYQKNLPNLHGFRQVIATPVNVRIQKTLKEL